MRRVQWCALFLALAGCGGASTPEGPNPMRVDARADGSSVAMTAGQRLLVTLANLGDGGYSSWGITTPPDPAILTSVASWHANPGPGAPPGNFGTDVFEFEAVGPGSTSFVATAAQLWTGGQTASFSFGLTVR